MIGIKAGIELLLNDVVFDVQVRRGASVVLIKLVLVVSVGGPEPVEMAQVLGVVDRVLKVHLSHLEEGSACNPSEL